MNDQDRPQTERGNTATLAKLLAGWVVCGVLTYLALDAAELIGPHAANPIVKNDIGDEPLSNPAASELPNIADSKPGKGLESKEEDSPRSLPASPAPFQKKAESTGGAIAVPAIDGETRTAKATLAATPWPELELSRPPHPFFDVAFKGPAGRAPGLTGIEMERWLATIPNADGRFFSEKREETSVAGFDGLVKLRPAWPEHGVLRFAPFAHDDGLALHFWRGDEGVSLYCYNSPRPAWAAYRTTRPRDRMRPSTHVLLATDDGRYDRTMPGVVEIRHQEEQLVLSRGDLRLLSVPFPLPPTEVHFSEKALFSELMMYRSTPIPAEPQLPTTDLFAASARTGIVWKIDLPEGATFGRVPDGALVLSRGKNLGSVRTHMKVPRTGLYEVVVEFDEVTSGTGIFLGDDTGQPLHILGFRRDTATRQPVLGFVEPDDTKFVADENVRARPVPFSGRGQWLKIVAGCGTVRCSVSGDGRNWGRCLEPRRSPREPCTHFGMIAYNMPTATRIGLRTLKFRELTGVTAIAEAGLVDQVPSEVFEIPQAFLPWCGAVLASQPPDVEARVWRMACAVRTLREGRSHKESNWILAGLLRDHLDGPAEPAEMLRVLDQAALAFDSWEALDADQLLLCYDGIGRKLADRANPQPYSLTARSLLGSSIWCSVPFQTMPEHLVRAELIGLLAQDQRSAILELCTRLRFWNASSEPGKGWPEYRRRTRSLIEGMENRCRDSEGTEFSVDDAPTKKPPPHPVVELEGIASRAPIDEQRPDEPISGGEVKPQPSDRIEPVAWRAQQRHEWNGTTGSPPGIDVRAIDWGARQIACVRSGDLLIASNRRQIACYNLKTGKRLWIHVFDAALATQPWPLLALRPAVASDRIFLRRPRKAGLGVVCVNIADGKVVWDSDPQKIACSDPLLIQGRIYCFTVNSGKEENENMRRLNLTVLDAETGRTAAETPVLGLRDSADRVPSCEAVLVGTRIVGGIAGAIACCDLAGKLLWLQHQTYFPAAETAYSGEQEYSLPIVAGSRVMIMQPGVLELTCLEAGSGRSVWRYPLSNGRRLLGADATQIYVETSTDIRALALADGQLVWRCPVRQMLDAYHLGNDGLLVYTQREPLDVGGYRPLMVWLETRSGRQTAIWPLSELKDNFPVMGPLVGYERSVWTFFGRGPNGTPRSLWQLTPAGGAAYPASTDPQGIDRWISGSSAADEAIAAAGFFPHWSQLGGIDDPNEGDREEFHRQPDVLATRAGPEVPVIFTREFHIDAVSSPRLVVTAGHASSEAWKLRVHAGGRVLLSDDVDATTVKERWKTWQVELNQFAGKTVQVVVEQHAPDREARGFWKQLEIVP